MVGETARVVVFQWRGRPQADLEAALRRAVVEAVTSQGKAVYQAVQQLGGSLRQQLLALREYLPSSTLSDDLSAEAQLSELPAPETFLSPALPVSFPRPWWFWWFQPWWRGHAEHRVRQILGRKLRDGLETYARFLRAWARSRIDQLAEDYDSSAGSYRLHLREGPAPGQDAGLPDRDELAKDLSALETKIDLLIPQEGTLNEGGRPR